MYIKEFHGKNIVCSHMFGIAEIQPNTEWMSSSGSTVVVDHVENNWIYYYDPKNPTHMHDKDSFSFQTRYCKVI